MRGSPVIWLGQSLAIARASMSALWTMKNRVSSTEPVAAAPAPPSAVSGLSLAHCLTPSMDTPEGFRAHHVIPWSEGGRTTVVVLALLGLAVGPLTERAGETAVSSEWVPDLLVGWTFLVCGLVSAGRRPTSPVGALLTATVAGAPATAR